MGIDTVLEYVLVAVGLLVLLGGLLVGLLRGRGGSDGDLPEQHRPPERPKGTTDHRSGTIVLDRPSDKATGAPEAPQRPTERDTPSGATAPAEPAEATEVTPAAPSAPAPQAPQSTTPAGAAPSEATSAPTTGQDEPDVYERDADVAPITDAPQAPESQAPAAEPEAPVAQAPQAPPAEPAQAPAAEPEAPAAEPARAPAAEPEVHPLDAVEAEPVTPVDTPAPTRDRMRTLRTRLATSNNAIGKTLLALLSSGSLSEEDWEDVEDVLLRADLGIEPTTELVDSLRAHVAIDGTTDPEVAKDWLYADLLQLVDPSMDRGLAASRVDGRPACLLVVGVNGTGKTTTVGKLARVLVANDRDVVLGAADTFRAAAADQLETWGARVGVPVVRSDRDGADPAAVAFDAVRAGAEMEADCVVIDTAGRLHNKVGLMDELGKIKRVVEKQQPVDEVLLVIDATTGQNGLAQAKVFAQAVDVTGVVLTKLDGTAKGGIVVAVQRQLGVPVKLVGLGEGPDDLAPFVPEAFVDAIVG
ncbi:signal recognition particle-docking protein FtsY [Janibacter melonis]|uniref:Signal recognition particle receptor FtsY n=2 Tax=Janibacter melonis TaxID=262209 RepID=A0A650GDD1_9MICO|nr:signal recognition particle-docking protein FtsY [Janibacter melonis]